MPEKMEVVDTFERIKLDAGCDDTCAAILTLAQAIQFLTLNVQISDDGYPERIGGDIARAIDSLSQDGAIKVSMPGAFKDIKPGSATPKKKRK